MSHIFVVLLNVFLTVCCGIFCSVFLAVSVLLFWLVLVLLFCTPFAVCVLLSLVFLAAIGIK